MRIPYAFNLTPAGALEIKENEAKVVQMIFNYYLAGASSDKVVDMLHSVDCTTIIGSQIM